MGDSKYYGMNIYGQHPPPRKCRNMKCSKSVSRPILGLLRAIDRYTVTERL